MPRKVPAIAVAALLCLLSVPGPALPQTGKGDYVGIFNATVQGGFAIPNTDEYSNTLCYQLGAGYSPIPWLEVDLEVSRFAPVVRQPDRNGVPTYTIASGDLSVVPVTLTAQVRYLVPEIFSVFYALGGFGYYFIDYEWSSSSRNYFFGTGAEKEQRVEDAWGFHLGAGVEYHMTDYLSLVGEGRYIILSPNAEGSWTDEYGVSQGFEGELDLNTWLFTGGVKILF